MIRCTRPADHVGECDTDFNPPEFLPQCEEWLAGGIPERDGELEWHLRPEWLDADIVNALASLAESVSNFQHHAAEAEACVAALIGSVALLKPHPHIDFNSSP